MLLLLCRQRCACPIPTSPCRPQTLDRQNDTCLHLKFWQKSHEKLFYFISAAACEAPALRIHHNACTILYLMLTYYVLRTHYQETALRIHLLRKHEMERADALRPQELNLALSAYNAISCRPHILTLLCLLHCNCYTDRS